ncbi:class I SAM-dependent methyltransferase [Marinimicrobium locisalis]|uniref:class I SAM-dependent methyltransferase n=1 Tax=Marinimicrobium locisalis TaxID=546022 RepID=UPI00322155BB
MERSPETKQEMEPEELAQHLRRPSGAKGREVGQAMNNVNAGVNRACLELLAIGGSDRVLEIGPANGAFVPEILEGHDEVVYTGLDWASDMVAEAERNNAAFVAAQRANFIQGSSESMPFADDAFDKVLAVNTLYFWDKPDDHIAQVARVMRPGGTFCLAFGDRSFMGTLAFTAYGFSLYDREGASELLTRNGFRIVNAQAFRETSTSNTGEQVEKFGHILLCTI